MPKTRVDTKQRSPAHAGFLACPDSYRDRYFGSSQKNLKEIPADEESVGL